MPKVRQLGLKGKASCMTLDLSTGPAETKAISSGGGKAHRERFLDLEMPVEVWADAV